MPSELKLSSKVTATNCGAWAAVSPPGGLADRASAALDSAMRASSAGKHAPAAEAAAMHTMRSHIDVVDMTVETPGGNCGTEAGLGGRRGCERVTTRCGEVSEKRLRDSCLAFCFHLVV